MKIGINKVLSLMISLIMVFGTAPYALAEGAECNACSETLTSDDVDYDENGDADSDVENPDSTDSLENESGDDLIRASQWAMEEVELAYQKNLVPPEMLGVLLSTDVTREQFAAIAVKLYERITAKKADNSVVFH